MKALIGTGVSDAEKILIGALYCGMGNIDNDVNGAETARVATGRSPVEEVCIRT